MYRCHVGTGTQIGCVLPQGLVLWVKRMDNEIGEMANGEIGYITIRNINIYVRH